MKIKCLLLLIYFIFSLNTIAQVGIGTTAIDDSAQLEVVATDKGILIPRMSETERLSIVTPAQGLLVYQTNATSGFWYYDGIVWKQFVSSGWSTIGDAGTSTFTNYVGTNDNTDLSIVTNNTERIRIDNSQQVGIGTNNPQRLLHLEGTGSQLRIQDGNQANGHVLTSDADGNASWQNFANVNQASIDEDWQYVFPVTTGLGAIIQRDGDVRIGSTGAADHLLDIDNGVNTGTTLGIGDVEFIEDGNNLIRFSHQVAPEANDLTLGNADERWNTLYATNGIIQTSDENAKEDITLLPYGINEFMRLRPVSFYWKSEKYNDIEIPSNLKQIRYGFIAQELDKIIPEVVYKEGFTSKSEEKPNVYVVEKFNKIGVNYSELIALLIKVEQDQHKRIQTLLKENREMKEFLIKNKKL